MGGKGGGVNVPQNPYEKEMAAIAKQYWQETAPVRGSVLGDLGYFMSGGRQPATATDTRTPQQIQMDQLYTQMGATSPYPAPTTTSLAPRGIIGGPTAERYDPYALPAYKSLYNLARTGLESQYETAKENIKGATPRGGQLSSSLANLEASRAASVGGLPAQLGTQITQDLYNKAYGAAIGSPQTTLGGLQGAGGLFGQSSTAATAAALQQQQMGNQMWGGLGSGLGALGAALIMK